jgi:hypothetical protein
MALAAKELAKFHLSQKKSAYSPARKTIFFREMANPLS